MDRRGFLGAILAAGVAPAIGHAGILMPVKKIVTPLTLQQLQIIKSSLIRIAIDNARLEDIDVIYPIRVWSPCEGEMRVTKLDEFGRVMAEWPIIVSGTSITIKPTTRAFRPDRWMPR